MRANQHYDIALGGTSHYIFKSPVKAQNQVYQKTYGSHKDTTYTRPRGKKESMYLLVSGW